MLVSAVAVPVSATAVLVSVSLLLETTSLDCVSFLSEESSPIWDFTMSAKAWTLLFGKSKISGVRSTNWSAFLSAQE